jgi:hypothetical protein
MAIKIVLSHLVAAVQSQALAHLSELIPPGGYAFRVAKLLDAVDREMADYNKQQRALITKYGVRDSAKNTISMAEATVENIEAFNKGMAELLDSEVTIPYEPIIYSKLGEEAQKKLSIRDVQALGPLLVEELPGAEPAPAAPPLKAV